MWKVGRAAAAVILGACAPTPDIHESVWRDYSATPPPRVFDSTVAIEFDEIHAPGNEAIVAGGFFAPAQRRAAEDLSNMFMHTTQKRDGTEDYLVRVTFRWDGELNPTIKLIAADSGEVLATHTRPSSRQLRAMSLNLRDSMQQLKGDLAADLERLPARTREPTPAHHDPL